MFSRVLACVAVWGCSGALVGAAAATLVEDLSTNSQVVASSPYATGGDLILKLGDNEFVHVFAKAAGVSQFVPNVDLSARVLLVGGGGGAGCGYKPNTWQFAMAGGGGGGGVREYSNLALAKSTPYIVTVGAGGKGSSSTSARGADGEGSSLADASTIYDVPGGGGGGSAVNDENVATGSSSATGGGASGWANTNEDPSCFGKPGNGSDYGFAGGEASVNGKNICGGGGGGAGEVGQKGGHINNSAGVQVGGNDLRSDILGSEFYFGGGGAGGSHSVNGASAFLNRGGLGGGGDSYANSYATCYANDGMAGYGGGGAGGWATGGNASLDGRNGGCGAVIIRYIYTPAGDSPFLSGVKIYSADGGHRAVVSGFVSAFGAAESATVTVKIWPTSDAAALKTRTVVVPCTQTDAFLQAVGGLIPGTSYDYEVYIDDADKFAGTIVLENGNPGISTAAATAQPVNGSLFEKYLVMPTGTNDVSFAGGYADVLVVGGGGAGGYSGSNGGSGGGGGGGVLQIGRKYFTTGTYRIIVGPGGAAMADKNSSAGWGSPSFVSLLSADDATFVFPTIVAYGGGRGQSWDLNKIEDAVCASTGGATRNTKGASTKIMDRQGYPGGSVGTDYASGGGGGAGGPGVSGAANKAGDGGPGKVSSITGQIVYYGAGGGGATGTSGTAQRPGAGGSGIGGAGWDYLNSKVAPGVGINGTGSGGGGGGNGMASGGAGGDGTVIFRYFDGTDLSGRTLPVVTWFPEQYVAGISSLSFQVAVPFAGIGSDGVSLSARYWTNQADCQDVAKATSVTLNSNFMDPATKTFTIANLSPARTYFVQVLATNSNGSDISSIYEMRTMQSLGSTLSRTQSQAYNTFVYSVGSLATGVSTLKLLASQDGGQTWMQMGEPWAAQAGDSLTVSRNFLDAEGFAFGVTTMCKLVMENSDPEKGVPASTCETEAITFTLTDDATYTWSDNVADGRWNDPASWTCNMDGYESGWSLGYPVSGSIVKFKTGQTNVVRLVKNEQCKQLVYNIEKAQIAYVGENVILTAKEHSGDQTRNTKNSTFIFDGVTLDNAGGEFNPNAGCALILRNGAKMDFNLKANSGTFTLDIGYGCTVLGSNFSMSGTGNTFVVDDGLAVSANDLPIGENSSITIKGDHPAIQARTAITAKKCYLDFYLPKTPYGEETANSSDMWLSRAPLRKNYINDNATHSLEGSTININRHSPVRTCSGTREFLLFDARSTSYAATSGIVTNNLQFTGLRDGEYIYCMFDSEKTTNPTRIYVHLKGSAGLAIRLR